ncbi:hypothetical protein [Methanobacterium sp.]
MLSTSISMTFGGYSIHPEKEGEHDMRVSEGVPRGRIVELYNPKMFQEREEVIVFTRDEISRTYNSIKEQIDRVNNIDLFFNRGEEWKLIGYWPKILASVYLLDRNLDSLLEKEPLQCYLDACLFNSIGSSHKNVAVSKRKVPAQLKLPI